MGEEIKLMGHSLVVRSGGNHYPGTSSIHLARILFDV